MWVKNKKSTMLPQAKDVLFERPRTSCQLHQDINQNVD